MGLFGNIFTFGRQSPRTDTEVKTAVTLPDQARSAEMIVAAGGGLSQSSAYMAYQNPALVDKIRNYREASSYVEVADAIDEIVDSAIVVSPPVLGSMTLAVTPMFSDVVPKSIQDKIEVVWGKMYKRLKFHYELQDLFRSWYIDGRLYTHKIIDNDNSRISKLVLIDSLNIKRLRVVDLASSVYTGLINIPVSEPDRYVYVYNNINELTVNSLRLPTAVTSIAIDQDAIAYSDSGLYDKNNMLVSYLERSIIPYNTVRQMESALAIWRIARSPVRQAFYVDVGALTGQKAEQFLDKQMARFKNKVSYDPISGRVDDGKSGLSIIEDYWLPRKEGSNSTSIETVTPPAASPSIEDVEFEHSRFIKSLGVPSARLIDDQNPFNDSSDITYAEHKFNKRIFKLRSRFANTFLVNLLIDELVLNKIIKPTETESLINELDWVWQDGNIYEEDRRLSKLEKQISVLGTAEPLVGTAVTKPWLVQQVFNISKEDAEAWVNAVDEENKSLTNTGDQQ